MNTFYFNIFTLDYILVFSPQPLQDVPVTRGGRGVCAGEAGAGVGQPEVRPGLGPAPQLRQVARPARGAQPRAQLRGGEREVRPHLHQQPHHGQAAALDGAEQRGVVVAVLQ